MFKQGLNKIYWVDIKVMAASLNISTSFTAKCKMDFFLTQEYDSS